MTDPINRAEYEKRFAENYRIEGFGLNVSINSPCPFCSAAGFMVYPLLGCEQHMQQEHTCSECGRSGKIIISGSPAHWRLEAVQTGGSDPPSYLPPMRRV